MRQSDEIVTKKNLTKRAVNKRYSGAKTISLVTHISLFIDKVNNVTVTLTLFIDKVNNLTVSLSLFIDKVNNVTVTLSCLLTK